MLAEEYILIATSIEAYSASPFLFIFTYWADGPRTTSTAESPTTLCEIYKLIHDS
jgi:hypothetical protein